MNSSELLVKLFNICCINFSKLAVALIAHSWHTHKLGTVNSHIWTLHVTEGNCCIPGHGSVLHGTVSGLPILTNGGHGIPPFCGCWVMIGNRLFVPPPHVSLHCSYSPHSNSQCTADNTVNVFTCVTIATNILNYLGKDKYCTLQFVSYPLYNPHSLHYQHSSIFSHGLFSLLHNFRYTLSMHSSLQVSQCSVKCPLQKLKKVHWHL